MGDFICLLGLEMECMDKNPGRMFRECSRLTNIDVSSFDTGSVTDMGGILYGCSYLSNLYTPNFLTEYSISKIGLDGNWYDAQNNQYTSSKNLPAYSILIRKYYAPQNPEAHIVAKKKKLSYTCGDMISTDDITVMYYGTDGTVAKQTEYTTNVDTLNADMNTAGEKILTVTCKGLTAEIKLTVGKLLNDENVIITLPDTDAYSYIFDRKAKKPVPTVVYNADAEPVTLTENTDYTVSYKNNKNAYKHMEGENTTENTPTVIIIGCGAYTGRVSKTFEIQKAAAPATKEVVKEFRTGGSSNSVSCKVDDYFTKYGSIIGCTAGTPAEDDTISGNVIEGEVSIKDNVLNCSISASAASDDFVTVPVTVSFVNYEDATLNVKIVIKKTADETKKKVTISGIEIKNSVYNKTPVSYTGTAKVVSEENNADLTGTVKLTYTYSGTQADGTVYAATQNAPVNAGSYKLTVAVAQDDKNYTGSVEYPFTIAKAPLIITARDMGLKIGAELPKAEDYQFDIAGLLEGDTLITNPTLSCSIADTAAAGEYDITVSGADAGMNYDITYKNGTLTVSETGETAKYYTVIFNLSGKGSDITNTGVKEGSLLEQPREPQMEGYIFTGWYKDQACTVRWDFATDTVQADTTLYAGWKKKDADPDNEEDASWHISEIAPAVYTGNAIKPAVAVYDSEGTLLKAGTYYTIAYKNNTEADRVAAAGGTGSAEDDTAAGFNKELPYVVITGKGNYQGTIYRNFHINPASISDDGETPAKGFTLKYTEQFVTANKEQKPFTSIKYKKAMTIGKDYDIAFSKYAADGSLQEITSGSAVPAISANDAGTFRLVITGKGNFSGTIEKDIYVGSKDSLMKNAKITVGKDIKSVPYTGADIEPKASGENGTNVFTVKIGSKFLTPETDYTVSYRNNRAAGTATIIVKGKGQYIGTKSAAFTMAAASQ